jgi:CheY-like chemotaxis protein
MSVSKGLLLSGDMLFSSRVTGTATALGGAVDVAGNVAAALGREELAEYRCVILDLALQGSVREAMERLRAAGCAAPVVAFGSHVQTERMQEAVDAGCAEVLPRSRFTEKLAELLREYLRAEAP